MQKKIILYVLIIATLCLGAWLSWETIEVHVQAKAGVSSGASICNISESVNCSGVVESNWSELWGVPLGSYGLIFYGAALFLLVMSFMQLWRTQQVVSLLCPFFALSALASLVLFIVSKFIIGILCPLCLGLYAVSFFTLLLAYLILKKDGVLGQIKSDYLDFFRVRKDNCFSYLLLVAGVALITLWSIFLPKQVTVNVASQVTDWPQEVGDSPLTGIDLSGTSTSAYFKGDKSAKVQIVKFADFECPGCRHLGKNVEKWLEPFKGEYYLVFQNYPLDNACNVSMPQEFHKYACYTANLARCAGEQGQFWEVYNALNELDSEFFEGEEEKVHSKLSELILSINLDHQAVFDCVRSERQLSVIKEDIRFANSLGLVGTPSIYINGKLLSKNNKKTLQNVMKKILR